MAIQIQGGYQQTTGSGFLPGGSRENSQAATSNNSKIATSLGNSAQKSSDVSKNINLGNIVNSTTNQNGGSSTRNSSQHEQKTNTSGKQSLGSKGKDGQTKIDDTIIQERDQLIKYIKQYIKKNNELPPTTLNFYKFVKLIGKGAFGKVTLGIHKLTGKQVAIKTIEKNYMQDDFSKRKVF